jgi:hypothetical protein
MEKDPFLLKDRDDGMDVVVGDKVEIMKKKIMGPPGSSSSQSSSL